jgi:hypothetical protein
MSLLDGGGQYEPCVVFPEEVVVDRDGNDRTRPAKVGIPAVARFQLQGQSGTSSRRQEQDNEGYESEKVYSIRFPRSFTEQHGILGAQSQIEWLGVRWALFGDVGRRNGSRRTARVLYTIKRF